MPEILATECQRLHGVASSVWLLRCLGARWGISCLGARRGRDVHSRARWSEGCDAKREMIRPRRAKRPRSKQLYAGTSECFKLVREYLDGYEVPFNLVGGNHDLEGIDEFDTDKENLEAYQSCV